MPEGEVVEVEDGVDDDGACGWVNERRSFRDEEDDDVDVVELRDGVAHAIGDSKGQRRATLATRTSSIRDWAHCPLGIDIVIDDDGDDVDEAAVGNAAFVSTTNWCEEGVEKGEDIPANVASKLPLLKLRNRRRADCCDVLTLPPPPPPPVVGREEEVEEKDDRPPAAAADAEGVVARGVEADAARLGVMVACAGDGMAAMSEG